MPFCSHLRYRRASSSQCLCCVSLCVSTSTLLPIHLAASSSPQKKTSQATLLHRERCAFIMRSTQSRVVRTSIAGWLVRGRGGGAAVHCRWGFPPIPSGSSRAPRSTILGRCGCGCGCMQHYWCSF
ncbi:hypothetical protein SODALDRAFT_43547 [Sodiomyces alkalinus F11]|uniref:Uncharacterized protein n=1 Tax=Sodiomyces alkalinus (strain CBS 110278 / VKM F-3762 / F11) TaxID=1314773 RepID=A0A3N2QAE1_SODAK|nr:hypothetical protein SODALDRAFT_43547 [Sodiomyces alkalinus F11]ROT43625.1 hypothetical protein SODALDRAFT_43547 [Sodiomyces alkalinus F11]